MHNRAWLCLSYEELTLNPKETLGKIGACLGLEITEKMIDAIKIPSRSTQKKYINPELAIHGWKKD